MSHAANHPSSAETAPPTEEEIREALARVLANPGFAATERRRAFLTFVVEESLAGRARALKGFTVANAVFGRDESFDSKTDPVVRLEARRLRRDLDSYYIGPGAADPIRIAIPKGGYAPLFEVRRDLLAAEHTPDAPAVDARAPDAADARRTIPRKVAAAAVLILLASVVAGLLWGLRPADTGAGNTSARTLPKVAILPFEALDPSQTTVTLAHGLGSELIQDLRGFGGLRLYAPLAASDLQEKLPDFGRDLVPAYVVRGEVQTESERATVIVQLLESRTDEVIWGRTYDMHLSPGSIIDLRDSVSAEIAAVLGQVYGPLNDDIRNRAAAPYPSSLESYFCVLKAYSYRRNFALAEHAPVLACLEEAVTRNPDYADAWAMLGWLHLDAARYLFVPPEGMEAEYASALAAAERAYALDPGSVLALKALSSIHHHLGNYAEGEMFGRRALELNPYDPDTLAEVGWRLAVRGKFDEGVPLMEEALARSIDPPAWYYHLLAMNHFMEGDLRPALELAELSAAKGSGFGSFLLAAAAGALGDAETAALALEGIAATPSLASDPAGFMRRHGATEEIIEAMMSGYAEALRLAPGAPTGMLAGNR